MEEGYEEGYEERERGWCTYAVDLVTYSWLSSEREPHLGAPFRALVSWVGPWRCELSAYWFELFR
jgi:hypothetical protein